MLELLTVISVVGLLLALILPAVMAAREASRRNQCVANLKNLGAALSSFEATHRRFPAYNESPNGRPPHTPYKWQPPHMALLPFVDLMTVYQNIDFNKPSPESWIVSGLPPIAHTVIPVYRCPSNGGLPGISYRGCAGTGPDIFEKGVWPGGNGTFVDFDGLPASEFRDGLSRTVAFSEKVPSDDNPSFGTGDFWYTGLPGLIGKVDTTEEGINALITTCSQLTGPPPYYHAKAGRTWYLPLYAFTLYNHALTPNSKIPDCSGDLISQAASEDVRGSSIGLFTPTSYHTGGVNVVFCDGHTDFVSSSVDLGVWRAMSTRNGSETVSF